MRPKKPPDEPPDISQVATPSLIVHCGLRTSHEDSICDKTRAHMLVMPEESCEAEFRWRAPDGVEKTLWLEGRRAIFVPKAAPYKIVFGKTAAFLRMELSDAFAANDAAIQKKLASVQIRYEWQMASVDFLLHSLFKEFEEQCRRVKFPGTSRHIESAAYLFAVHSLKIFAAKETGVASGLTIPSLRRVQAYVDKNLGERIHIADMAREAGLGTHHFTELFKISTGLTPHRYLLTRRIERAQQLLHKQNMRAADVAAATGFSDESHLWHSLKWFFTGHGQQAGKLPE